MIIMILEKVPIGLRGELSRWLLEPRAGVFVGQVSALVRDKLWEKCCNHKKTGGILQIWSTNTEQRFQMRADGDTSRQIIECEGLQLIQIPHNLAEKANGSIISKRLKRLEAPPT
ncbi:MAG: type I-E CRISPR-associated endoribonuclease Cas2 [Chloroflexi bacterium]|nr:MAG: type I-E CRISPR-associated endoribonuclease Cas2 [Chloroflexota bacterium]